MSNEPSKPPPVKASDRKTSEKDKTTFLEKISYAFGLVGFSIGYSGVNNLAYPIFNMTLHVSPTLIGLVLGLSRLWDALTDPLMGSISDNAKLRWGRRKPFILLGSILCALVFPLMWFVPLSFGPDSAFWWFLIATLLFYTCFTIYSVPYLSLSYEMTPDSKERTRISAVSSLVAKLTSMTLPWVYRLAQADFFPSTMVGMRVLSVLMGIAFVGFAIPMIFNCKERFQKTSKTQKKIGVISGLKETAKNRPFVLIVSIATLMQGSISMIASLGIYINSYYIFGGDTKLGASYAAMSGMVYAFGSIAAIPVVTYLSNRLGKRNVMFMCLSCCIVASFSKFFFYTPAAPFLQFISVGLMAPGQTAFYVLLNPMKADTADYDEYKTGLRREGTYAAVSNWVEKVGLTVALFLSGYILDFANFDVILGGDQTDATFLTIRLLFTFVPVVGLGIGIILLYFYPLTDDRMYEIRDEMEGRRGAV